jgi:hypothetical protein
MARSWGTGLAGLAQPAAAVQPAPPVQAARPPAGPPSTERRELGELVTGGVVVLARRPDPDGWQRVPTNSRVTGAERLVSLPGYTSELRLDSGVTLQLAGNLPGFFGTIALYPLYESEVVLHAPPAGIDADLTLNAGRVRIVNQKGGRQAVVRVRFANEIWDVTLPDADGEVLADLIAAYPPGTRFSPQPGAGEKPMLAFALGVTRGRASVQPGYRKAVDLAVGSDKVVLEWDNKGTGLDTAPEPLPYWSRRPDSAMNAQERAFDNEMRQALTRLSQRLSQPGTPAAVALGEARTSPVRADRILSVLCLPALDALSELLDALADAEYPEVRYAAYQGLQHWTARRPENDLELHAALTGRKNYSQPLATTVLQLLHGFSPADRARPETYEVLIGLLGNDKLAVRHLAIVRLAELDNEGARKVPFFDAAGDADARARSIDGWKKRIPEGKVPPAPSAPPVPPAGVPSGPIRQGGPPR